MSHKLITLHVHPRSDRPGRHLVHLPAHCHDLDAPHTIHVVRVPIDTKINDTIPPLRSLHAAPPIRLRIHADPPCYLWITPTQLLALAESMTYDGISVAYVVA